MCAIAFGPLLLVLLCGCEESQQGKLARQIREAEYRAGLVQSIQREMIYFQDKRTGLCFAYYWGGAGNGGPALTLVPREKVQEFLVNP